MATLEGVLITLTALTLGACSSSTEPVVPVERFLSTLTVTPLTARPGENISAIWTIENPGPDTVTRVYDMPGAQGFLLMIGETQRDSVIELIAFEALAVTGDSLTLAPHSSIVFHSKYLARAAGSAQINACLPPDSTQGTDWVCISKTLTVKAGL